MVAVMGAITSVKDNFKYITKSGYFNSDDTIEFLRQLLNFHRHRYICMYWDNASIHVGKKVKKWMATKHRIIDIENPQYCPDFNGIACCKVKVQKETDSRTFKGSHELLHS